MAALILDGKPLAEQIQAEIQGRVAQLVEATGKKPKLAAVLVGEDPASQVYVRNKEKACAKVGIASQLVRLPESTTQEEMMKTIHQLNVDDTVSGILVQLPLPGHLDATPVLDAIDPLKDVDCFHPVNVGMLSQGRPRFLPCTPHGVVQILHRSGIEIAGKHVVILGRSEIVGKPLAMMLVQKESTTCGKSAANATVTLCHSRTQNLADLTREADIVVAAIGQAKFLTADMVKPGAVIIDVGINRTDEGLVGDVDYQGLVDVASAITPVPGGVGRLTVTMLLENTLQAAKLQAG